MGDAGEGLVDADARIQELMDQREADKKAKANNVIIDAQAAERAYSKELVRASLRDQLAAATHPVRRAQLEAAIKDIDAIQL
ncbi:MAG: hypothetical protein WCQ64_11005 [Acidobacteriota bacterium]|jgi:hypothetical protein